MNQHGEPAKRALIALEIKDDKIVAIYIMRNPDKLRRLSQREVS